jgi:hypothetical protein
MALDSDTSKWLLSWHREPDNRVCPGCIANSTKRPMTLAQWEAYGLPLSGDTECGDNCRCILVPTELIDYGQNVIGIDVPTGGLPKGGGIPAAIYQELSELIATYKALINVDVLPPKFYDNLMSLDTDRRILYLQQLIEAVRNGGS